MATSVNTDPTRRGVPNMWPNIGCVLAKGWNGDGIEKGYQPVVWNQKIEMVEISGESTKIPKESYILESWKGDVNSTRRFLLSKCFQNGWVID